jgi:hypothetical protein
MTNAIDAKQALIDMLKACPSLEGVETTWGFPSGNTPKAWCYVGKIVWSDSEWVSNRKRQETFRITVVFNVQDFAADAETAEKHVKSLADDAEAALDANPKLGLPQIVTSGFDPKRLGSWPIPDGTEAQYEVEIEFVARPN